MRSARSAAKPVAIPVLGVTSVSCRPSRRTVIQTCIVHLIRHSLRAPTGNYNVDFRRGFGATQCVKSAAIPTAKCSVSYSNTSSARCRADSGIVRPSALAVFRLTANSNKAGCSIGSSPGLSPRRIRAT